MDKIADEGYEFNGTRIHVRAFVDPLRREKPVFVIEEGIGNEKSLDINRVEIAKELAGDLYRSPEEIIWLELAPDRSLKRFEFQYTHTDRINRDTDEMRTDEIREAYRKRPESFTEITRYNHREEEVSRQDFQSHVGDALEPYERRQNEEFRKMEVPPVIVDFSEMCNLPSQHDFENEPDLSL